MKLSVVASNRDRFKIDDNASKWFLKSIQWQDFKDFELVIADGGSSNYEELKQYFESLKENISVRIVQYKIGEAFERARLNNVGVRRALGEYVMTTDVDMLFGPEFMSILVSHLVPNAIVESRTMYWRSQMANRIYSGEVDPHKDVQSCKIGKIKKRTTAGGCQCMHRDSWNKLRGFDETYIGWGSEDHDLLQRAKMAGLKEIWLGEGLKSVMLFHQPHLKTSEQTRRDLAYQAKNKKILGNIKTYIVNPQGWGGME